LTNAIATQYSIGIIAFFYSRHLQKKKTGDSNYDQCFESSIRK